ncbi:MAG: 4-(cytidine 5'-diphospho)-2-C-methyl-D-erythritol kinase [Opitutaceae bacterium]|nr:4-(cytidine 5'-diphospho)-2-C-methyl-D-erythritol kinase [Opitutaceae bacterium]
MRNYPKPKIKEAGFGDALLSGSLCVQTISQFAPAKLNLFLAITGRRPDGFHNLVSVAAPLNWGDQLDATSAAETSLWCDDAALPVDESNLVMKAAAAFRAETGWSGGVAFRLTKRIPQGAGLGGGSSNAVAALRAMNALAGHPLDEDGLRGLAARLGSDCALFLGGAPVVMRGRGERIDQLGAEELTRWRGQRVFIFKPGFGVATPWAYRQMAARPETYLPDATAEARLRAWREGNGSVEALLFNNMESVVFAKYPALPVLHDILRERFGLHSRMSGSGSASFALVPEAMNLAPVEAVVRSAWGPSACTVDTRLA